MSKKRVGSRWSVVAMIAVGGGVLACSSSNSSKGFPESDDGGGSAGTGGTSSGYTTSGTSSSSYTTSGATSGAGATAGTTSSGYSSSGASSSSATSGNTSSGATSGAGTSSGTASCNTTSTGGLALMSGYQSTVGMGGYAFAYEDKGGSTACVSMAAVCGSGSTVAQNATYSNWGGGIGINVSQMQGAMAMSTYAVKSTSTGLTYALSSLPPGGRLIITDGSLTDGTDDYCFALTAASGTIPWTMFNSKCYDSPPDGKALAGPPQQLLQVKVQTGGLSAASTFDFCIDTVTF